tara:strand:+ start:389 stop:784 length:396 start_codon:yes stop_codon:yes gene_type:complete
MLLGRDIWAEWGEACHEYGIEREEEEMSMRPSGKMGEVSAGESGKIAVEGVMCRTVRRRALEPCAPAEHRVATHQERHEKNVCPIRLLDEVCHLEELGQQRHVGAMITQVLEGREACVRARVLAEVGALDA